MILLILANFFSFSIQVYLNVNFIRALKWEFVSRIYSWIDLVMMVNHICIFSKYTQFLNRYGDEDLLRQEGS